jgi:hypothetical protein
MKSKIKKILLDTLTSAYDDGNIDNGGIIGGDNAIDLLYDLFVDEMTAVGTATVSSRPESEKSKKFGDVLYTNPETGKTQKLFDILIPVFAVRCDEPAVKGHKGCSVIMYVNAPNEKNAIDKALKNKEFTSYIDIKYFDRKYLSVCKPTGIYKIDEVIYFEGDERL